MSAKGPLRVALVGGPMYDHLYGCFEPGEVEVVVHADHPTLNRSGAAAGRGGDGSTSWPRTPNTHRPRRHGCARSMHSSLAARSPRWRPGARVVPLRDRLLCLPRLIDVRVLWVRRDRVAAAPRTWDELVASDLRFGFPGRESGLFGTFFELVVGTGGTLFDESGRPSMASPEAVRAIKTLCALAAGTPDDLPSWHYDEVDAALLDGRVDATGAWPGAWGSIRSSACARAQPHPYPSGSERWVTYAGCHGWAVPKTCADLDGALGLLERLVGFDAQAADAAGGNICAHSGMSLRWYPRASVTARLAITRRTVEEAMITYPPSPTFPQIEDAGWLALHEAFRGACSAQDAVARMQSAAEAVSAP